MENQFEVGQKLNLDIKKIGINGEGIGYFNKMTVFVDYALPSENVDVEIKEVFDNRLVAKLIKTNQVSEDSITPFCPIYYKCGGCQLQHLNQTKIKDAKRQTLLDALKRYTFRDLPDSIVKETITSDKETHYRNKASLPVRFNGKNHVGMYQERSRKFIQMNACPIQDELVNQSIFEALRLLDIYKIKGYDEKYNDGFVQSIVCRESSLGEVQMTFILLQDEA